jgi:putative ABC transport system substrate-binding protein
MVSDPIGSGFVVSLARPGGNITGVTNVFPELGGKLLQFVREMVPSTRRVAVLWNPDNPGKALDFKELEGAARPTGVVLHSHQVRASKDFAEAFATIARDRPDALITLSETLTYVHRNEIAAFGITHRIPTAFNLAGHIEAGRLLSFSPDASAFHRRAGSLVGKVLGGARPADLPVERPTTFRLAINLKTAKALGLTIPQSVLARADEVIR